MFSYFILSLAAIIPAAFAIPAGEILDLFPRAQQTGCQTLSQQYPSLTSFPNTTTYEEENSGKSFLDTVVMTSIY